MQRIAKVIDRGFLTIEHPFFVNRWTHAGLGVSGLTADYFTGPFIAFPIFSVLPVVLVAWHRGLPVAVLTTLLLISVAFSLHFLWETYFNLGVALVNSVIFTLVFILLAALIDVTSQN